MRGFCLMLMSTSNMVAVSLIFVIKAVVDFLSLHLLTIPVHRLCWYSHCR